MSYTEINFVAFQVLTAANMNVLGDNDASFNDGTGIGSGVVTAAKRSGGFFVGSFTISATGSKAVTGVGFQPSAVLFYMSNVNSSVGSATNGAIGIGSMDSNGHMGMVAAVSRNSHGGGAEVKTDRCIDIYTITAGGGSKSSGAVATYTSMDSDGFTLNVSSYSGISTIIFLAMR